MVPLCAPFLLMCLVYMVLGAARISSLLVVGAVSVLFVHPCYRCFKKWFVGF